MIALDLQFFAEGSDSVSHSSVDTFYGSETAKEAFLAQTRIDQEKSKASGLNLVFDKNQKAIAAEVERQRSGIADLFDQIRTKNEEMKAVEDPAQKAKLWAEIQELIKALKEAVAHLMELLRGDSRKEKGHLFGHPGILKDMATEMSDYHEYMMDFADAAMDKMDEIGEGQEQMKAELKQDMKDLNKDLKEAQKEMFEALMKTLDERSGQIKDSSQKDISKLTGELESVQSRMSGKETELAEMLQKKAYLEANRDAIKKEMDKLPADSLAIKGEKFNYIITPSAADEKCEPGEQRKHAFLIVMDKTTGARMPIATEAELAKFLKTTDDPLFKKEGSIAERMTSLLSHTEDSLKAFENSRNETMSKILDIGRLLEEKTGEKDGRISEAINYLEKYVCAPYDLGAKDTPIPNGFNDRCINNLKEIKDHLPEIAEKHTLTEAEVKHVNELIDSSLHNMENAFGRDDYYISQKAELEAVQEYIGGPENTALYSLIGDIRLEAMQQGLDYKSVGDCIDATIDQIQTVIDNIETDTKKLAEELATHEKSVAEIKTEYEELSEKVAEAKAEFRKIENPTEEDRRNLMNKVFEVESVMATMRLDPRSHDLPGKDFLNKQVEKLNASFKEQYGSKAPYIKAIEELGAIEITDSTTKEKRIVLYERTNIAGVCAKGKGDMSALGTPIYTIENVKGERVMTYMNDDYVHEINRTLEIATERSSVYESKTLVEGRQKSDIEWDRASNADKAVASLVLDNIEKDDKDEQDLEEGK